VIQVLNFNYNHNKLEDNSKLFEKSNSDFPLDYSVDVTAEKLKSLDISTNPKVCWFPENFRTTFQIIELM
jgi:hypothetical protein